MKNIKTTEEIAIMREAGQKLARALFATLEQVKPGITTNELDEFFAARIKEQGAEPLFLGYHGYPKHICTSVNGDVVHGIPTDRVLEEGDIIGIDSGLRWKGWCADMARTVPVGEISEEAQRLITVADEAKALGIEQMRAGNTIGDVGAAVQTYSENAGFGVVKSLVGHGIGQEMHEAPQLPNYGKAGKGKKLEVGMVLAIEPMINVGGESVEFDEEDGWTVRTADGTLSAHSEDTVAITENGPEILTRLP
jgi:methionyl aminopeptidase